MGDIRRYRKKARYPIGASGVPGDASALLTEQRAVSRFAEVGSIISASVGQRIMRADEKAQTITGQAEIDSRINLQFDTYDTDPDESNYAKGLKKTVGGLKDIIANTTNSRAKTELGQYITAMKPRWDTALNAAVLNRQKINTYARRDQLISGISGMDLSDPGEKLEAEGRVGQGGDLMRELGHSPEQIENWMDAALKDVDNQTIYQQAEKVLEAQGYDKAVDFVMKQKIDVDSKKGIVSDINFEAANQQQQIEIQRETDRDEISKLILSGQSAKGRIERSYLDEKEQWTWHQRERAEAERLAKGEEIETDPELRSIIYSGIFQILTGAKTKQEVLDVAKTARMPGMDEKGKPIPPTLDEDEYQSFEKAINAQYEQSYTYNMGQVNRIAEGLLLNPDSLGYIKNAPIRYKTLGDFRKAWLQWVSDKGDTIKISEIYPEGMRMAAAHQISDDEAERQEIEMIKRLKEKEATVWPNMPTDKKILEAAKKVASEPTETKAELPQPKTKEEYDKLESGTKYIDPEGVERTKK